jgi:hypothetical protein
LIERNERGWIFLSRTFICIDCVLGFVDDIDVSTNVLVCQHQI